MVFKTDYKLEEFILNTKWEDLSQNVKVRMRGCLIDLLGTLLAGSKSNQFKVGLKLSEKLYGTGDVAVVGTDKKFNFMGAATAMGHSSNAFDIDDGHNMTRDHPGTSFAGAIVYCDFGIDNVMDENLGDEKILSMMKKVHFEVDEKLDSQFPAKRICRAEIYTKEGRCFASAECEPRGEAHENISISWLCDKFCRITKTVISKKCQDKLIELVCGDENISIREIVDMANSEI